MDPWIIDGNSFLSGKELVMLIKRIIENNINGDIIEAGCWRGGVMIFVRTILNTYNQQDRKV